MQNLKSLAKDTAIYGMSSIVGRFLNYLLVPLYTAKLSAESGGYGVITNVYAYTALLLVVLTYGMETTFFRFANKEGEDPQRVYSTILASVGGTSLAFVALVLAFLGPISSFMGYADHPSYVWVMAVTVAIDAFQCIPFAYLRHKKRPLKFAALKLLFIVMNIALNLFFFVALPELTGRPTDVGYALLHQPGLHGLHNVLLLARAYGLPLRVRPRPHAPYALLQLAGARAGRGRHTQPDGRQDSLPLRVRLARRPPAARHLRRGVEDSHDNGHDHAGASRYAYEPFVFGKARDKDNRQTYARAMKYFVIFTLLAFLVVVGYLGLLKFIIGRDYWSGLRVVPIVMAAEIMMGVYFNLSFWYKLTDRTIWGAWFSGAGCAVLVAVNVIFVPRYGYMACAWAGVAGYATAMLLSYFVGQRHYPIDYPLRRIFSYVALAAVLYCGMAAANSLLPLWGAVGVNTALIAVFVAYTVRRDFPLSALPVIGRHFRKPSAGDNDNNQN